jgi:hypothetical protein
LFWTNRTQSQIWLATSSLCLTVLLLVGQVAGVLGEIAGLAWARG